MSVIVALLSGMMIGVALILVVIFFIIKPRLKKILGMIALLKFLLDILFRKKKL